jgi:hypothetical protein
MPQIPPFLQHALTHAGIVVDAETGKLTVDQWLAFRDARLGTADGGRDMKQFYQEAASCGILPPGVNS